MTFETLRHSNPEMDRRLRELVERVNAQGGTYHRLDFGRGLVMRGTYDMSKYISHYHLAESLDGQRVLDAGTAAGYFALECARRGASVTAIDVWDDPLLGSFLPLLHADVKYAKKDIYDLTPEFGQFDLVICGSVLIHLPDPLLAIRRLRSVCAKQLVICTSCPPDSQTDPRGICEFVGERGVDGDYWNYWSIGVVALARMLRAAGFSNVLQEEHVTIISEPGEIQFIVPAVTVNAAV